MTASAEAPAILVAVERRLVEQLLPGAIAEAQAAAHGFVDGSERASWIAGRLGIQLARLLRTAVVERSRTT